MKALFSWKMLAMLALGFSSGAPFLVIRDVIKAWLTDAKIDLVQIGLISAVSFPYTFKFVWSPLLDRYSTPFLGRRRGWMLVMQAALLVAILALGRLDPTQHLWMMSMVCMAIAFFSASQDIVLDAFRREFLTESELGAGTGIWVNGYRLANLATVGIAFALADKIGYANVHFLLAGMMFVGIITTLLVKEPVSDVKAPRTLKEAVVEPFVEFFRRREAWWVLAFILLYKIGDNMASAMNIPFILSLGFEKTEYFVVVKGLGMAALFLGMFLAGVLMLRIGISRALWIFGGLQMISTFGFSWLAFVGKDHLTLSAVVVFELLATGLGSTAYTAYMSSQTNRRFTATQYALMTSLMAVPGTIVAAGTGFIAQATGWPGFYAVCALAAIPGMLILAKIAPWGQEVKVQD